MKIDRVLLLLAVLTSLLALTMSASSQVTALNPPPYLYPQRVMCSLQPDTMPQLQVAPDKIVWLYRDKNGDERMVYMTADDAEILVQFARERYGE